MKNFIIPLTICLMAGLSPAAAKSTDVSVQVVTPEKLPPPIQKEQTRNVSTPEQPASSHSIQRVSAQSRPENYEQRVDLAEQVHEYLPIRIVVEDTLDILTPGLSAEDSARFKEDILSNMDLQGLEQLSIQTMAEIFTEQEIEAMIDYYGKPEAKSINQKLPAYREVLDPAIINAISTAAGELSVDEPESPENPEASETTPRRGSRL